MTTGSELLERHVRALNERDLPGLLADFTPDAVFITGSHRVPEGGLAAFFHRAMTVVLPRLTLHRVIEGDGVLAAEMSERWTEHGQEQSAAILGVFDVADGRFQRVRIYKEELLDAGPQQT